MSNIVAKIVALLSLAGFAVATIVLATGSSEAAKAKQGNLPGSVALGGDCTAFQDCRAVPGKVVECRCTEHSQRPVCVADLDVGQDCSAADASSVCRPGTRCTVTHPRGAKAVCLPVAKAGEACGPGTGGCEDPAFCDGHVCVVGHAGLGQTCGEHAECETPYVCPGRKHVCSRPAKIGEACETNPDGRSECVAGAGCNGNRCVAKKVDGANCRFDEECLTGLCGTNGCGRGPASGEIVASCGI